MKKLMIALIVSISFARASEPIRDLEKFPLTINESQVPIQLQRNRRIRKSDY